MRNGEWLKNGGYQLSNKTVGIVGFGHIGQDIARLLQPFGCTLLCYDIVNKSLECSALGVTQTHYSSVLEKSDIITFHVPGSDTTHKMFGLSELEKVKPTVFIVNTARGDVIDFSAVVTAAQKNKIGGFAADVFPEEPCGLKHLAGIKNLFFTPHIGGSAMEAIQAMGESAIAHVQTYLQRCAEK
jgi:D-3-phosphoglycerate dehydrogenase